MSENVNGAFVGCIIGIKWCQWHSASLVGEVDNIFEGNGSMISYWWVVRDTDDRNGGCTYDVVVTAKSSVFSSSLRCNPNCKAWLSTY